ncbi:FKBP-type peptidyl-prolyl cis-trans isomerase [soil metagenome]
MLRTNASVYSSLAAALVALVALGACGDESGSDATDVSLSAASTTVSGSTTTQPTPDVSLPEKPPTELVVTDLETGSGPEAAKGDRVIVNYVGVLTKDGTEFDNSYKRGEPFPVTLGADRVIKGWEQGLVGIQAGGRRQLDVPADLAYGDQGSGETIKPGDAISFVIDAVAVVPATTPDDEPADLDIQPSSGATEIVTQDVRAGDGAEIAEGQTLELHLIAIRGDNAEQLDSTWAAGPPVVVQYARAAMAPRGLYEGLAGMKVGGRRIITIPADKGFGEDGNTQISLPPSTDLILVVDLFAAY